MYNENHGYTIHTIFQLVCIGSNPDKQRLPKHSGQMDLYYAKIQKPQLYGKRNVFFPEISARYFRTRFALRN